MEAAMRRVGQSIFPRDGKSLDLKLAYQLDPVQTLTHIYFQFTIAFWLPSRNKYNFLILTVTETISHTLRLNRISLTSISGCSYRGDAIKMNLQNCYQGFFIWILLLFPIVLSNSQCLLSCTGCYKPS